MVILIIMHDVMIIMIEPVMLTIVIIIKIDCGDQVLIQDGHDDAVDMVKDNCCGQVLSQVVGGGEETTTPFSNIFPTTTLPTPGKLNTFFLAFSNIFCATSLPTLGKGTSRI